MKTFTCESKLETVKRTVVVVHCCDLCGKNFIEADKHKYYSDVVRVHIDKELGSSYPGDGGNIVRTVFDLCVECFDTKLVAWFKAQGAEPRTEEVDW